MLYVETLIRAPMDDVWRFTQDPARHERWDARFSRIEPQGTEGRFRYATRVLPGLTIAGTGVSVGQRRGSDGSGTSALRFACPHPLSLIRSGSGYWRYLATESGVRFLTGYDYVPGWGRGGRVVDRAFRPLFGWATAWSFDRLRLWLERGVPPERARDRAIGEVAIRLAAVVGGVVVGGVAAGGVVALAAILVPPLPGTPAARRCRRRPPDRRAATAPAALSRLRQP